MKVVQAQPERPIRHQLETGIHIPVGAMR
jgi:hypothetical protein